MKGDCHARNDTMQLCWKVDIPVLLQVSEPQKSQLRQKAQCYWHEIGGHHSCPLTVVSVNIVLHLHLLLGKYMFEESTVKYKLA